MDAQGHVFGINAIDTISNGLGMVADHGTVHVAAGTYNENVQIEHPLVLSGANAGVPASSTRGDESVVSGSITVYADGVTVDGFAITGGSWAINAQGSENKILNNAINETSDGIYIYGPYSIIQNNAILAGGSGGYNGIEIDGPYAIVDKNVVNGFSTNIYADRDSYAPRITDNTIDNTGYSNSVSYNIDIEYGADNAVITGNNITNDVRYYAEEGIYPYECSGANISYNNITNAYYGLYLYGSDVSLGVNYVIENNRITTVGDSGSTYGIYGEYISNATIKGNYINATDGYMDYGIYLDAFGKGRILDNTIENAYYCVCLEYGTGIGTVIDNNTLVYSNSDLYRPCAIYLYECGDGMTITHNKILGNTDSLWDYGICSYDEDTTIAAIDDNYMTNMYIGIYYENYYASGAGTSIANNTIWNYVDENGEYGIYTYYGYDINVHNNNISSDVGYWDYGFYGHENGNLNISNNLFKNCYEYGIYDDAGCAPMNGVKIIGNTITNTIEMNSFEAIYIIDANAATFNDNVINSTNGTWNYGIDVNGYRDLIDGNRIANAQVGIQYRGNTYSDFSVTVASGTGTQPASDWCTVQNNFVNLTDAGDNNMGILYSGHTGFIDYNTVIGDDNTVIGIGAYCDNVSIIGNDISNVTLPDLSTSTLYGSALAIASVDQGSIRGTAYLAGNQLTNNRVQMMLDNMAVFNMDNAGTVARLDNDTLTSIVGSNALDKAYWIVTTDGDLKVLDSYYFKDMLGSDASSVVAVFNSSDDAGMFADTAAGDKIVQLSNTMHMYHLVAGWNLIGIPLNVQDYSVEGFFPANVRNNMLTLWTWNEASQEYNFYGTDPNDWYYTQYPKLNNLETGKGYWVEMKPGTDMYFTIEGIVPSYAPASSVDLVDGWNMVSITGNSPQQVATMYPDATTVWIWNPNTQEYNFYGSDPNDWYYTQYPAFTTLNSGDGDWVEMTAV